MLHYYPRTGDLFHNKSWLAATKKSLQRNMKVRFSIYLSININENIGFLYGMHYYFRTGDLFHNKSWLAATKKSLQRNMKVRFCIDLSINIYRHI